MEEPKGNAAAPQSSSAGIDWEKKDLINEGYLVLNFFKILTLINAIDNGNIAISNEQATS